MTADPPFEEPRLQLKVMDVAVRIETISIKLIGAFGVVRIIAPFPTNDS